MKAAFEQQIDFFELKKMARTSLEHAFLRGESIWAAPDNFTRRKAVCAAPITATSKPTEPCAEFLKGSERATEQYELERRYAVFEASIQ